MRLAPLHFCKETGRTGEQNKTVSTLQSEVRLPWLENPGRSYERDLYVCTLVNSEYGVQGGR